MLRAADAAQSNADWCDALCGAHGCRGERSASWWLTRDPTPPGYPSVVTLGASVPAGLDAVGRLEAARGAAGWAVKDSFAVLPLETAGFRLLFEAVWIGRPPQPARQPGSWIRIQSEAALAAWEAAWGESAGGPTVFPAALLARSEIAILGSPGERGAFRAGVVARRGRAAVDVSNFFARGAGREERAAGLAAATATFPGLPLLGYESGPALEECEALGFEALGPLRVWLRDAFAQGAG
jgi:hypothetical protein